jgi:hypothetical protein
VGEIRKGEKSTRRIKIIVTEILKYNTAGRQAANGIGFIICWISISPPWGI